MKKKVNREYLLRAIIYLSIVIITNQTDEINNFRIIHSIIYQ